MLEDTIYNLDAQKCSGTTFWKMEEEKGGSWPSGWHVTFDELLSLENPLSGSVRSGPYHNVCWEVENAENDSWARFSPAALGSIGQLYFTTNNMFVTKVANSGTFVRYSHLDKLLKHFYLAVSGLAACLIRCCIVSLPASWLLLHCTSERQLTGRTTSATGNQCSLTPLPPSSTLFTVIRKKIAGN